MNPTLLSADTHIDAPATVPVPRPAATDRGARRKLRVGVVGLGRQALDDHIPGIGASDSADLVAVCGDDPAVLSKQEALGVPTYTDFRQMLAAEQLDFVVVTVPHHVGATVVEAAAEHGVHVLKEKPFATTLPEAQRLVQGRSPLRRTALNCFPGASGENLGDDRQQHASARPRRLLDNLGKRR